MLRTFYVAKLARRNFLFCYFLTFFNFFCLFLQGMKYQNNVTLLVGYKFI